jgi:large subunit ribosomal protein L1
MAKAKQVKSSKPKAESAETKEKQVKHGDVVAEAVAPEHAPKADIKVEKVIAKSGKRSAKSLKETEEKQAKESRKAEDIVEPKTTKTAPRHIRTKAERAGKKYREAIKQIDKSKTYPLGEALELATKTSTTKFDASVELHINLGVDPRQADQNVRDNVVLPAGTGKKVRIAVLAEGDDATKAKKAGADIAGTDEIFAKLDKEELDFDVLIATPALMPKLGKYARLLGPRGLMPNPKSGTVSQNPEAAVTEAKAGKVEYRVDQAGIIHISIGKVSFGPAKLAQNADAILASVRAAKPASIKGIYLKSAYVTSTMGPSIKLEV